MEISRIGSSFAAEVKGLSIKKGIDAGTAAALEQAIAQFPVLCFRNQRITDDEQAAFISLFGPMVKNELDEAKSSRVKSTSFVNVTSVDDEGNSLDPQSERAVYMRANQYWHTDGSPLQPPLRISALSACELPSDPPVTLFADMRAAWNALPDARKRELEGIQVEHNLVASRARVGMKMNLDTPAMRSLPRAVVHPLVRTHRKSGRKSLYLGAHASHVIGRPVTEGSALLEELVVFATQPQFVYTHHWEPSDLLMWDNSCTLHRATPYDRPEPRVLRWASVLELEPV